MNILKTYELRATPKGDDEGAKALADEARSSVVAANKTFIVLMVYFYVFLMYGSSIDGVYGDVFMLVIRSSDVVITSCVSYRTYLCACFLRLYACGHWMALQ